MSRLEEKLIELGYKHYAGKMYIKFQHKYSNELVIEISQDKIINFYVYSYDSYIKQEQIDNLQQAFNEMQKDLEELKNVESER